MVTFGDQSPVVSGGSSADFWRTLTNAVPDGVTDPSDAIRRLGNTGIGGAAVTDAMPTIVTPTATNTLLHLSDNVAGRGQLMFGSAPLSYYMERAVPVAINGYIEICSLSAGSGNHPFYMTVEVSDSGFSTSKQYAFASKWNETVGAWRVLQPMTNGGAYSGNDFEILVSVSTNTMFLRLRRKSGATAGTARIRFESQASPIKTFTEMVATGNDPAVYAIYNPFPFPVSGGISFVNILTIPGIAAISPFPNVNTTNIYGGQFTVTNPLLTTANLLIHFVFGEALLTMDNDVYNLAMRGTAKVNGLTANSPSDHDRRFQRQIAGNDRFSFTNVTAEYPHFMTLAAGASVTLRLQYDWNVTVASAGTGTVRFENSYIAVQGVAQ